MKTYYARARRVACLCPIVILFLFFLTSSAFAQIDSTGTIKVILQDKATKEVIPFANVVAFNSHKEQVAVGTTNMDGHAWLKDLQPGLYTIKGVYVGYQSAEIKDVLVAAGKISLVTLALNTGDGVMLCAVECVTGRGARRRFARADRHYARQSKRTLSGYHAAYPLKGEGYEESAENIFKTCTRDPLSTFSADVDVASYANIRRMLMQGTLPPKEAVRIEEMINYFRFKYEEPKQDEAFGIHCEISACPWNKHHRLLQVGMQTRAIEMKESVPNNLTFLIDVSGSMADEDKLPLLRDALSMLVKQIREKDRVAIVVYAGNAGLVLPSTKGSHMQQILDAINNLEAGGSTAGGEGILLAYKVALEQYSPLANNRVILATDGDFNVGVSDDASLVKLIEEKRDQGIFLSVLGFGTGNYQDAKMEKLADKGNGNYAYIDNLLEAKKVLVKEMNGTLVTVAKDVKIQVEFNPKYVKSYRLIGYDNRMLAHEDFKNDKKDAGDVGSGHSVTALYEIVPADARGEDRAVDDYKYQKVETRGAAMSNEVCTIKLRYKKPNERTSKQMLQVVNDEQLDFEKTSDNFRFCTAVAELGLMLRQSQFKGESSFSEVIRIASTAKGSDMDNYRAEFIRLCELAEAIVSR